MFPVSNYLPAFLAERSKAVDSSSIIFGCVGSNPTECTFKNTYSQIMNNRQRWIQVPIASLCILYKRIVNLNLTLRIFMETYSLINVVQFPMQHVKTWVGCLHCVCFQIIAHLAEWSKAVDLSSIIFGCVGSNPTVCNKGRIPLKTT